MKHKIVKHSMETPRIVQVPLYQELLILAFSISWRAVMAFVALSAILPIIGGAIATQSISAVLLAFVISLVPLVVGLYFIRRVLDVLSDFFI